MDTAVVAVNVGGTTTRVGIVIGKRILASKSFNTDCEDHRRTVNRIVHEARGLIARCVYEVVAIGACVAGNVDSAGFIKGAAELRKWIGINVGAELSDELQLPAVTLNDAKAEGLGEFLAHGVAFTYVSWGTGIGVSEVTKDESGRPVCEGTERGHDIISFGGEPCMCGGKGHFEAILGAANIARRHGVRHAGELSDELWNTEILPVMAVLAYNLSTRRDGDPVVMGGGVTAKQLAPAPEGAGRLALLQSMVNGLKGTTESTVLFVASLHSGLKGAAYAAYQLVA